MNKLLAFAARAMLATAMGLTCLMAHAQQLEGPLRVVAGYPPGGASDRAARLVGEALQAKYGINVVVENKVGAGGRVAAQQFKHAAASDNVLMLGNPAAILAQAIQTVTTDPALKQRFSDVNMELGSMSQQQTVSMLKDYKTQWEPVVKRSGYEP